MNLPHYSDVSLLEIAFGGFASAEDAYWALAHYHWRQSRLGLVIRYNIAAGRWLARRRQWPRGGRLPVTKGGGVGAADSGVQVFG